MLAVNDLAFSYGDNPLFSKCSFRIGNGRHVALVGDNGTGKTTLLRLITGILKPDAGIHHDAYKVLAVLIPDSVQQLPALFKFRLQFMDLLY